MFNPMDGFVDILPKFGLKQPSMWLYAQLHYFLNFSHLLCLLSAIIGQTD